MTESWPRNPKQPLVTAYIPVYNHQRFVGKAIEGILSQTYHNIELIIINDGSSDCSDEIIRRYIEPCKERFVRFAYLNRANKGLSETINEAIKWSHGEYVAGCASDDYWSKEKTVTQVMFLEDNKPYIGCGSGYAVVDDENKILSIKSNGRDDYAFKDCLIDALQPRALTVLWRKNVFGTVGLYDKDTKVEDWEFMLRVLKSGAKVATLDIILAFYRTHSSNTMKQLDLIAKEENAILAKYSKEKYFRIASRRAALRQEKRRLQQGRNINFNLAWLVWCFYDSKARQVLSLYLEGRIKN